MTWPIHAVESAQLPYPEQRYRKEAIAEIERLDPVLLDDEDCRSLVEVGIKFGAEVTQRYGTPARPQWADGSYETDVLMSYHNGGTDGHTSLGQDAAGVPRNVLRITQAVNAAAGNEIYAPAMRAAAFCAAEAHDVQQLCGRAIMPEGQGEGRGDERISAKMARMACLEAGVDLDLANYVHDAVMATAFNPQTGKQNVAYAAWQQTPDDDNEVKLLLVEEAVAAADLLSPTTARGPLGAIEYSVEQMCLQARGRAVPQRLAELGIRRGDIVDTGDLLDVIADDSALRSGFIEAFAGQPKFQRNIVYADVAIRQACGQGIDNLFPGREQTAEVLEDYSLRLNDGISPRAIWESAKRRV